MTLAGVVWNDLPQHERLILLRHCKTITHESIKQHEKTLNWNELMPVTQRDLENVDFESALQRQLAP